MVDLILSFLVGCVIVVLVSILMQDSVTKVDITSVQSAVSKCTDSEHTNIKVIGNPTGIHSKTTVTCADGSIVTVKK